jgi:putative acetyltransferase
VIIEVINPQRDDVKCLINQADSLMLAMYPPQSNHLDGIDELSASNVCFVGAFIKGQLAGIGAVKIQDDDGVYGEIKRVFVDSKYRGQNVAVNIMHYLEQHLVSRGVSLARLETGDKQFAAIGLYQRLGYGICPPYGSYLEDPFSVFMEKHLAT